MSTPDRSTWGAAVRNLGNTPGSAPGEDEARGRRTARSNVTIGNDHRKVKSFVVERRMCLARPVQSHRGMCAMSGTFVPPHCPRSGCPHHLNAAGWRWVRHGSYSRNCQPRIIPRFRCRHCGSTFSAQTFSATYYLKRPELLERLFFRVLACSGYRQIAREARCTHSTLMRQAGRLGRHCLLYLARRGCEGGEGLRRAPGHRWLRELRVQPVPPPPPPRECRRAKPLHLRVHALSPAPQGSDDFESAGAASRHRGPAWSSRSAGD